MLVDIARVATDLSMVAGYSIFVLIMNLGLGPEVKDPSDMLHQSSTTQL